MRQIYRYIIYMVAIMLLASCYPIRRVGLLQERSGLPEYEKGEYELYRLQKNDELELRIVSLNMETALLFQSVAVSSVANSSFTYRIYEDGTIDIPFLSKVKVAGLTLQQAEQKIENELSGFADDIIVKLALSTGTFCVIGDAGRGYFPIYKDRLTIYQALALSGGVSPSADLGHVKILRRSVEGTKIIEFDIRPKSVIDSEYYYVYPNDVIYFDFSKRRFWAIDSYSGFLSVISSSLSMLVSVWNAFN
ncbi:MAG: polysaccharide biosynthesis/export family protein [Paludibacteraceae bacterium]|nr:polysaccharide biosynthesis/export family protein [Paludibacteraceae bacterium]